MSDRNREDRFDRHARRIARLKLLAIVVIIAAVPAYLYLAHPEIIKEYSSAGAIMELLKEYRHESALVYIGLNVLQVICSLPGQVFHLAGGYAFGFWLALPLTFLGVGIGCTFDYFVSRKLGHDAIRTLFGGSKVTELLDRINSRRGIVILFVSYLIPGMPKDLINYVGGLSDIRYRAFIILCMGGRLPGMMVSLFIGNEVTRGNYTRAIIVAALMLAVAGICLLRRRQIMQAFEDFYEKYVE